MKADEKVLQAIVNIRNNPNWIDFVEFLVAHRDEQGFQTNMISGVEAIYVSQGRYREVNDLIELIQSALPRLGYVSDKE